MNETTYTIKAGTVVHVNGIPVEVVADTPALTNSANIQLLPADPPMDPPPSQE